MIALFQVAEYLETFLNYILKKNIIDKFQIYVKANNTIEVYTSICGSDDFEGDEDSIIEEQLQQYEDNPLSNTYAKIKLDQYKIEWNNHQSSEYEDDLILKRLSKKFNNNIDRNSRLRFGSILSDRETVESFEHDYPPIVTFYSYKGGMGRTTTLMSYAIDLALNRKKKVLIIDCDLEAPGYLNFFNLDKQADLNSGKINGLVEFLSDISFCKKNNDVNIDNYWVNVVYDNEILKDYDGSGLENIRLMPAGNLNIQPDVEIDKTVNQTHYLEGLSRINLANKDIVLEGFKQLILKAKEGFNPDVILIDSRTGFNDVIGTISLYLSNFVVAFLGFSAQTRPGRLFIANNYKENKFNLAIVNSILPKGVDFSKERIEMLDMFNDTEEPPLFALHRNSVLEKLGQYNLSENEDAGMKDLIESIKNSSNENCNINGGNEDFFNLFSYISQVVGIKGDKSSIFENEAQKDITKEDLDVIDCPNEGKINPEIDKINSGNCSAIQLRNYVLNGIEQNLKNITAFAEDTNIKEKLFFYRECMNELFKKEKFIIQGYKGTGKTYLYKSLANPETKDIADNIKKRARKRLGNEIVPENVEQIFIDVISREDDVKKNKNFDFKLALKDKKDNPDYFDESFWKIHTWISILLHQEFAKIKEESKLSEYIEPINGPQSVIKIYELLENGLKTQIVIDEDMKKIDDYLSSNNKQLFLLYDQLDTRINPKKWGLVVSPLITFWRENFTQYNKIYPKIFIRTDLFKLIKGTNTARLSANKISIEWTIEEVFSYFFKLLFVNKISKAAFWQIALYKAHSINKIDKERVERELEENNNQFKTLVYGNMKNYVTTFFGKIVSPYGNSNLGEPWDYFKKELSNAEGQISLRPFVNMLTTSSPNGNVVSQAKKVTSKYIQCIISPEIYANKDIRINAAKQYFDDLTQDDFSKGLILFRDFLYSDEGSEYRYKILSETKTYEILEKVVDLYKDELRDTVTSKEELLRLLEANGIMAMKPGRGTKDFVFAPMYIYAWGLKNLNN